MNGEDHFEKRLQRLPQRPIPSVWRQEILTAVHQTARASGSGTDSDRQLFCRLNSALKALLWPHPKAWAGLGAAWLLVLGLNFASREPLGPAQATQAAPVSPQAQQLLREQATLLAELIGAMPSSPSSRPSRPYLPQPHSQRREPLAHA